MTTKSTYRRKLIEVDLPLDVINAESAREKSIRHGHPSTLHLWWARRPLAACRAVIFASLVDDPVDCLDEFPTEDSQRVERQRLHDLIKRLVKWEHSNDANLLAEARYEIARSVARTNGEPAPVEPVAVLDYLNRQAKPIYDPFCGGGSIPLEAQRLGLRAIGSDLNPVAVLITKALIELPPKFANRPPVNPEADPMGLNAVRGRNQKPSTWRGAAGLADDVRYYGRKMRELAWDRIGYLYPKAKLPGGGEATVIAWLWARTVPCSNPACGISMPLMTTFQVSKKRGNQHWIWPEVDRQNGIVSFTVHNERPPKEVVDIERTVTRNGATCIACKGVVTLEYVRQQARADKMSEIMTCVVAEGNRKRLFVSLTDEMKKIVLMADAPWRPQQRMPTTAYKVSGRGYGITHWHQLFTERQLVALTTFSDLLVNARSLMVKDGADQEYANVVCTYLALAIGRAVDSSSKFATWQNVGDKVAHVFARQAIPMVWDFAEANPFSSSSQNWLGHIRWISKVLDFLPSAVNVASSYHADAATTIYADQGPVIVTDPPYYDNISYAELSDYFYVWLRPLLRDIYPDLFAGILVPINEEMIAAPRFENAQERFESLMGKTLRLIRERSTPEFPASIFYAYKQEEEKRGGRTSTGWDTMLSALVSAGFQIVGTWPMRTERSSRSNALSANSLASSVVLVCRIRSSDATVATRREFINTLKAELPSAVLQMQSGNIAPVDLAQAAIGPGMAVFTRYTQVLDTSGQAVSVRDALALINQTLDEALADQEGDFDADTGWALAWFEQSGFAESDYGLAETLSKAKNTSVSGMVEAGILKAGLGKVRLLRPNELPDDWDPERDRRFTAWEAVHHLVRVLDQGELTAADMMAKLGTRAEAARELTYRLYRICDLKNLSQEAQSYNSLVQSWPEIARLAGNQSKMQQEALMSEDRVPG
jgi:putative DNA methylase